MRWAVVALVAALAGCPKAAPSPALDGTWPAQPDPYETATETWTRHGKLNRDYQLVAEVHALIKSPQWRAAWVSERAAKGKMSAQARSELEAKEQQADREALEIAVILTTWDRAENDLDRGERSVWRIVVVDQAGNEHLPVEIKRDRRPENVLRTEYPGYGDFSRVYLVKFPRDGLLGPGVSQIGLRMSSPRGGIELTWHGAR